MEIIRQSGYLSSVPLQSKLETLEELYHQPDNPLVFMNYVTHLMWQGGLSITTFSAKQTGAAGTFLSSEIVSSCSMAEKRVKSLSYN